MTLELEHINSFLNSFGANFKKEQLAKINEALMVNSKEVVRWPWSQVLVNEKNILLFAIGSLVNFQSATRTFKYTDISKARYAIAFGAKRLFNYAMDEDYLLSLGRKFDPYKCAALNVEITYSMTNFLNGIIFEVDYRDLEDLNRREEGYDLVSIPCLDWDNVNSRRAYILSAADDSDYGREKLSADVLPEVNYEKICLDAFASLSSSFKDLYTETTFLADGTLYRDYVISK